MPSRIPNSIALYFSQDSLRNTTITVTGTGVAYHVHTPGEFYYPGDRITSVTRVDSEGKKAIIGEYVWGIFGNGTKVRLNEEKEWSPMSDFLRKQGGRMLSQ